MPTRAIVSALAATLAAVVLAAPAGAASWPTSGSGITEGPATQNTAFRGTVTSALTFHAPLPAAVGDHPAACDDLHVLRIRAADGPTDPSKADRVLIAQPGIFEGASAFMNVGANLVTRALAEAGRHVELWAVDRRSNCLEDLDGFRLAQRTGDVHDLVDYYYRGKPYDGHRFAGFLDPFTDAAWLGHVGMRQTIDDWNAVITRGIPDRAVRRAKVYCGGHSLGGFITGAYATADFDGDPATTADAGYEQCAGFFGLDTLVTDKPLTSLLGLGLGDLGPTLNDRLKPGSAWHFISVPGVIDPELMGLLSGLGVAADRAPDRESDLVSYLPANPAVNFSYRLYHSRTWLDALAPTPSLTRTRYTNAALFGVFTDDNSMPLSIVQASSGFFAGGPVADKEFPFGTLGGTLAIPTGQSTWLKRGPLYRWNDYDRLGAVPDTGSGVPYTSPAKEVTDVHDLARSFAALPMNFVEFYFPTQLAVDALLGTRDAVHPEGLTQRPIVDIIAGDGPHLGGAATPPGSPVAAGYNHLDVLTAAAKQNDGRPEPVTSALLTFIGLGPS
jgi:hypothetical protein